MFSIAELYNFQTSQHSCKALSDPEYVPSCSVDSSHNFFVFLEYANLNGFAIAVSYAFQISAQMSVLRTNPA